MVIERNGNVTQGGEWMPVQWYLLKTWVGREEELVKELQRIVPSQMYEECFVIRQERIWRKQQRSIVHVELLFPGCVFLTCKEAKAELENTALFRLAADGVLSIFPMTGEDGRFLEKISGDEHMVRLSYVQKDEEGNVCKLSEPLKVCQGQVERYQFKKRYAMVRHRLWGEDRLLVLGIALKEDGGRIARRGEDEQKPVYRGDGIR